MAAAVPFVSRMLSPHCAQSHLYSPPHQIDRRRKKEGIDDPDNWRNFPHQNESQFNYSKSNACTLTKIPTGRYGCRCCVGTAGMNRPLIYHGIGLNKLNYVCLSLAGKKHSKGLFQYFHTEEADIVSHQRVSAAFACGMTL